MEPTSAPRLADVRVRVPAATAPAPAVAEEGVHVAVRERPPEVVDDEEQSPRRDNLCAVMPAHQLLLEAYGCSYRLPG